MKKSPYLSHPARLGEVISLIQTMGTSQKYSQLSMKNWEKEIGESKFHSGDSFSQIAEDHPEFFRLNYTQDGEKIFSLALRSVKPKDFDSIKSRANDTLPPLQIKSPLKANEVAMLINVAIRLHAAALSSANEKHLRKKYVVILAGVAINLIIGIINLYKNHIF